MPICRVRSQASTSKLAALREHRSQLGTEDLARMITEWARTQGKRHGLAAAEAFRLMLLDDA